MTHPNPHPSPLHKSSSGGGGTLDVAYDSGGAGAGRTLTVDAGAVVLNGNAANNDNVLELNKNPAGAQSGACLVCTMGDNASAFGQVLTHTAIGAGTHTKGAVYQNTTAAAAGAQQDSPSLVMIGQGWKTNATAASQEVRGALRVRPVQSAANPTGELQIGFNINGAGYAATPALTVTSAGGIYAGSDGAATAVGIGFSDRGTGLVKTGGTTMFLTTGGVNRLGVGAANFYVEAGPLALGSPGGSEFTNMFVLGYWEGTEMTAPAAPAANQGRVFFEDVAGKTRLAVRFPTGATQQIAIEP